jgi:hypothetical protein
MNKHLTSLIILLALALTGCGAPAAATAEPQPNPTHEPLSTIIPLQPTQGDKPQMNPTLPAPSTSGMEGMIEKAKEDLAQRLSIPMSEISFVEARAVTWSDGSLGCPQDGMMYAQVLTAGYLVKLQYDAREFEYHAGQDGALSYCKNPLPPAEGAPADT